MRKRLASFLFAISLPALVHAQTPDWTKINDEAMRHFQALVRIDSTDPPGKETKVVEYVKQVLDAEGIPSVLIAKDPARANLIARLKGNGSSPLSARRAMAASFTDAARSMTRAIFSPR
jgi:hypothetical protein